MNKPFFPVEFEEEQEKLVEVSIEVVEVVYYTSEEENNDAIELDLADAKVLTR